MSVLFLFATACGEEQTTAKPQVPSSSQETASSSPSSSSDASSSGGNQTPPPSSSSSTDSLHDIPIVSDPVSSEENSSSNSPEPVPRPTPYIANYYYSVLDEHQQSYYDRLYAAAVSMESGWIVLGDARKNHKSDIAIVRSALVADHPELFWIPSFYVAATTTDSGVKKAIVYFSATLEGSPSYLVSRTEMQTMSARLREEIKEIKALVTATNPFEIEHQLHDILLDRVAYATDTTDQMIYTAYGAIVNGKAVCEGYSKAMKLLLDEFKISSITVTGTAAGENHMWNMVCLNGDWYHLDTTWDDLGTDALSHEFFNLTDSQFFLDHTLAPTPDRLDKTKLEEGGALFNLAVPPATATTYNYFVRTGLIFSKKSTEALADTLMKSNSSMLEFAFSDKAFADSVNSSSDSYINKISLALSAKNAPFTIGGYSVTPRVLRIYKSFN